MSRGMVPLSRRGLVAGVLGFGAASLVPASLLAAGAALPSLVGQLEDGRRVDLRELTAGKACALQFVFTSCVTVCPLLGALFKAVQGSLDEATRERCLLLSVSVDPENDTPSKLRRFLERHQAGPGWHTLLLGRADLTRLLAALGEDASSPALHSPQTIVFGRGGDERVRLRELAAAPAIVEALEAALK